MTSFLFLFVETQSHTAQALNLKLLMLPSLELLILLTLLPNAEIASICHQARVNSDLLLLPELTFTSWEVSSQKTRAHWKHSRLKW